MKRLLLTIAALAAPLYSASAQANLSFSGGSGTQLAITLSGPVQYTITSTPTSGLPSFVFVGAGDLFGPLPSFTGSINYSINGAGAFALTQIGSGFTSATIAANDMFLFGNMQTLVVGDVIRLNAGTLSSVANFASAAPTSRAYTTFIIEDGSAIRSSEGVPITAVVPEPESFALMGVGLLALVAVRVRRENVRRENVRRCA
ncbi:MAG: PEP-CTERM sorting domain-containing protein [Gemmatimonas sp.]